MVQTTDTIRAKQNFDVSCPQDRAAHSDARKEGTTMAYINCHKCGKLIPERDDGEVLCKTCEALEDSPYRRVREYVYHHQGANIIEVSEATGVSKGLILQYLKEGRIHLMDDKSLLSRCETCGRVIDRGRICLECMKADLGKKETRTLGDTSDKKAKVTNFGRRTRR